MYTSGVNVYKYVDVSLSIDDFEILKPKNHSIVVQNGNPLKNIVELKIELINNTYSELSIYNNNGQRLKELQKGMLATGAYTYKWDASKLSSGIYHIVLYTYFGYSSLKVVIP